jgi:hypothetical protein
VIDSRFKQQYKHCHGLPAYLCEEGAMSKSMADRRSPLGLFPGQPMPRLYDRVVKVLRTRHYSRRTEEAYLTGFAASSCFMPRPDCPDIPVGLKLMGGKLFEHARIR